MKTLFIEPSSSWENGYNETFNGKLRDETSERRNLLHTEGGASAHRTLETALQHDKAALLTGVQAPSTGKPSSRKALIRSSFNGDYDRIRPSLDIESNLKSGIVS